MGHILTQVDFSIRGSSLMDCAVAMGDLPTLMAAFMRVSSLMTCLMVTV